MTLATLYCAAFGSSGDAHAATTRQRPKLEKKKFWKEQKKWGYLEVISELEIEGIFVRKYNKEIKTSYNGSLLFNRDQYNNAKD